MLHFSIIGIKEKLAGGLAQECPDLGWNILNLWGCAVYLIYVCANFNHKIVYPPTPAESCPRPRLIERLNEGLERRLTLISASAGIGKTPLGSDRVDGCERPVAWLSLDEGDNDPSRFLSYIIPALQTIKAEIALDAYRVRRPSVEDRIRTLSLPPGAYAESMLFSLLTM